MTASTPRLDAIQAQAQNLIINGNFDFWQRGITVNLTASWQYLADRFATTKDAVWTGISTNTQSTDVPTYSQSGFNSTYSCKITNGNGASPGIGDLYLLKYMMEGSDYAAVHKGYARLQFWVKSSVTGTFPLSFHNNAGNRSYVTNFVINVANTWEPKTIDFQTDQSGTWALDNTAGLIIYWGLGAGSAQQTSSLNTWISGNFQGSTGMTQWAATTGATFQVSQVQIIPGNFTTSGSALSLPFRRAGKTIPHELVMCQRYYEKSYELTDAPGTAVFTPVAIAAIVGGPGTNRSGPHTFSFKVSKRTAPTFAYWDNAGTANQWLTITSNGEGSAPLPSNATLSPVSVSTYGFNATVNCGGGSGFLSKLIVAHGHYTADAEL